MQIRGAFHSFAGKSHGVIHSVDAPHHGEDTTGSHGQRLHQLQHQVALSSILGFRTCLQIPHRHHCQRQEDCEQRDQQHAAVHEVSAHADHIGKVNQGAHHQDGHNRDLPLEA